MSRHGAYVGIDKIINSGSDALRWNLLIFSEGYLSSQVGTGSVFDTDARAAAAAFLAETPFSNYAGAINVHRVDVSSTAAGARDPRPCGGPGGNPRTYFKASYCNYGQRDFLMADYDAAIELANAHCADWDGALILVNHGFAGGSAKGRVAVCSKSGMDDYLAHEMGHVFGLADEYVLSNAKLTQEPGEINATIATTLAGLDPLWAGLVPRGTPIPTERNAGCKGQQNVVNPTVAAHTIGLFEGAYEFGCGAYRPAKDCKMRTLAEQFCKVCAAAISEKLQTHL